MKCPYCEKEATYGPNEGFYGRRYTSGAGSYMAYYCLPCRAYVGVHKNSTKPLGTMANDELRKARMAAHANIDRYWKEGTISRAKMYSLLKERFGREIHVGESDLETAQTLAKIVLLEEQL